ncbi:MAG TPA: hypothetical protein VF782_01510 [Allosphingosinicella sp.]|jgi:hypothetical protein
MRKFAAAAALVPAAFLLMAASGYLVTPSKNKILQVEDKLAPGSEITVRKGEVFYARPVGRAFMAVLGGDLTLTIAGKSVTLPAGTQLNVARKVAGKAAGQLDDPARVFCTPTKKNWNMAKGIANLLTLSLFASSQRTDVFTQFCVVDSEGDGMVDKAFLAGARKPEDLQPVTIEPTPISVSSDVPLPGESEARLRFAGGVGILGNLGIDLEVVEEGNRLSYSNGRTLLKKSKLPRDVNIFGASFTVLSYDSETKEARIRWNSGFLPAEYGITTTTTTTYIPVYIPR